MPPCISQLEGGLVQVAIEVEDRAQRSAITSKIYSFLVAFIAGNNYLDLVPVCQLLFIALLYWACCVHKVAS